MWTLQELGEGGTLENKLRPEGALEGIQPLGTDKAKAYTQDMMQGLSYLHSMGIIHRDMVHVPPLALRLHKAVPVLPLPCTQANLWPVFVLYLSLQTMFFVRTCVHCAALICIFLFK